MYLRLENLYKVFPARGGSGEVTAVHDVNVSIEKGEFVTLLGPSGCGKTTTLRLIAGFEFPSQGRIVLDGQEINELPPNRRDMAMVFQSYAIFPHLNVYENIAYGLKIRKLSSDQIKRQVARVLELTELGGLEQRAPNQLSGGQQQRVALARALVMEPKVLLMDEPLSNLDAKLREQMRTEIREIQQRLGITSVYVTHDQVEAMSLSDRVVVMNLGRVEQIDPPQNVYRKPKTAFVANFIGRTNFVPATVAAVEEGALRVDALAGALTVSQPETPRRVGDRATLVVRPDAIRLTEEAGQFAGVVKRSTYLGSQVEYEVDVAGQVLIVVESDPRHVVVYPPGAQVGVNVLAEAIYVLP
ncbi:MAG TPA: ABC transporter ATP-binding protein [Anaerolineae bacterium]|nr:ABC transporter ATP-binding protein [Anaerolineae bacterium]HNU05302.1 ABC transporter ATP-binding protein [Anaerolineae bacterium]